MAYESQNKWIKENMTTIAAKLNNKYDQDIIEYINSKKSKSDTIKKALRFYMAAEKDNKQ